MILKDLLNFRLKKMVMFMILTITVLCNSSCIEDAIKEHSSDECIMVTDDADRPLKIFRAISGMDVYPTTDTYSYSYTSPNGSFHICIDGSKEPGENYEIARITLILTDKDDIETIYFVTSDYLDSDGSRSDKPNVPVIM